MIKFCLFFFGVRIGAPGVSAHDAALRLADETHDLVPFFGGRKGLFDDLQCLGNVVPALVKHAIDVADLIDLFAGKAPAVQPDGIDPDV